MSLAPSITADSLGVLTLHWTADPNADGYLIVTPSGRSTAGKAKTSSALGVHASISVTIAPLHATNAEQADYPAVVDPPPPPPSGVIEWAGGYDPAFTGWDGAQRPGGVATITSVKASAIPGLPDDGRPNDLWARFMVRPGDFSSPTNHTKERAELNNFTNTAGTEGRHGFWAWSTFFPVGYDPQVTSMPQFNIYQGWQHQGFLNQAMFNFEVDAARKVLMLANTFGDPASPATNMRKYDIAPLVPGTRYDHLMEVFWSIDKAKGFFVVWLNGKLVVPRKSQPTLYQDSTQAYAIQMLYRQAKTNTDIIYQTGLRRASTYAAAVAGFPGSWPTVAP